MPARRPPVTLCTAWLAALLLVVGCHGPGREGATPAGPAGAPIVIVPEGAALEILSFLSDGRVSLHADLATNRPGAGTPPFPLLAYRQLCGDVRLEDFELANPRMAITTRRMSGEQESVRFGAANFTGGGIYAAMEGSPCVYLVTASSVYALAALAGETAAAPFRPPPKPEFDATGSDSTRLRDPWVEQAQRHEARTKPNREPGQRGGTP